MRFDPAKFENVLQVGGIRTGTLDHPNPCGGQSCRVAHVDTGSGLRFTVALDRGGDIVEASYRGINLTFLTQNDYTPPSPAYHRGIEWLASWPGGLLTTAGPEDIGEPRNEEGRQISLHGRFSNTPAALTEIRSPDPAIGELDMQLTMTIRDCRMMGCCLQTRRQFTCTLGEPVIDLVDRVTNCGDQPAHHAMLYHVNFGYPLIDEGSRLVYRGRARPSCLFEGDSVTEMQTRKTIPAPSSDYTGAGEGLIEVETPPDERGDVHAGVINEQLQLGVELLYRGDALPRLANWHHFGPRGSYVTALEPYYGSIFGKATDSHPSADGWLAPGESRSYALRLAVRSGPDELAELDRHDGELHFHGSQ